MHAKSLQSYPTLCDPMDPPGSSVHGNLQQEYSSGLPFPPPGDLPHPGMKPTSLMPSALAGGSFTTSTTWELQDEVKWSESRSVLSDSLWPHGLHRPRNSPGQNTMFVSMILFLCLLFSYLLLNTFDILIFLSSLSTDFLILFMVFLWQGYRSGLPFLLPVDHVLSGEGSSRRWDGWMASLAQWTWIWANSWR